MGVTIRGLRVQLTLRVPPTVVSLSPESCDAENERLRGTGMDFFPTLEEEEEEEDGTFRTPIAAIDAIVAFSLCVCYTHTLLASEKQFSVCGSE